MKAHLLCLLTLTLTTPGVAEPQTQNIVVTVLAGEPTTTVEVTRADFASNKARKMLDIRVGSAIETVCGSYASIENSQWPEMDMCWSDARTQVKRQLSSLNWANEPARIGH